MKWHDWVILGALVWVIGAIGSDDFNYKCKEARDANPAETCKMIASK